MIQLRCCKVCGSDSQKFRDLFIDRDRFYEIEGYFKLQKCSSCGVVFLNPQPSFGEIRKYYTDEYYSYHLEDTDSATKKILLKIKSFVYKRGFSIENGTRILDVGCGNGEKVSKYLSEGAECYGVEINRKAVEMANAKGVKAFNGDLLEQNFDSEFFDVIIMDNVFEHLMDPGKILKKTYGLLKKNGILVITIPNHSSFTRVLFGRYWLGYHVPCHYFSYSPSTIKKIANANKLMITKTRYVQNGYIFIASFRSFLRSYSKVWKLPSESSQLFDNRLIKLMTFVLLFPLNLFRMGDTIKVFLEKR